MGSRGVSGYTYSRKVQLAKKIATIDKKLAKIEDKANKVAFSTLTNEYKRRIHGDSWDQRHAKQYSKEYANYEKGHYMAEQGAGKLRQQKKQYTKELAKLNAGQVRMFR